MLSGFVIFIDDSGVNGEDFLYFKRLLPCVVLWSFDGAGISNIYIYIYMTKRMNGNI